MTKVNNDKMLYIVSYYHTTPTSGLPDSNYIRIDNNDSSRAQSVP